MNLTDAGYNYQVFGIEMVDIPTSSYYLGDGTSNGTLAGTSGGIPLQITSNTTQSVFQGCCSTSVPAAYPLGYSQFYMMKYEISQDQYVGFLNTLTYQQQQFRTSTAPANPAYTEALDGTTVNRNYIEIMTPAVAASNTPAVYGIDQTGNAAGMNAANDGQWIACNWMDWDDLCAYLCWAGLRPMSELEFEKACRGPVPPVANAYPWGNTLLTQALSSPVADLSNPNTATEVPVTPIPGNGECAYGASNTSGVFGPLRVGFAATAGTIQSTAGAGYYGVLDLAGNVFEQTVPYSTTTFTKVAEAVPPVLSATGYATYNAAPGFWPTYANTLSRGGDWYDNAPQYLKISDRSNASSGEGYQYFQSRHYNSGGRGVRVP
jgi:formylglycine-generating enzyme required for sulfatase activity